MVRAYRSRLLGLFRTRIQVVIRRTVGVLLFQRPYTWFQDITIYVPTRLLDDFRCLLQDPMSLMFQDFVTICWILPYINTCRFIFWYTVLEVYNILKSLLASDLLSHFRKLSQLLLYPVTSYYRKRIYHFVLYKVYSIYINKIQRWHYVTIVELV